MLEKIERYASEYALSDIHIRSDQPVAIREDGIIRTFVEDVPTRGEVESFISSCMDPVHSQVFDKKKNVDLGISAGKIRFRANFLHTFTGPACVLRKIETAIPRLETLGLPPVVYEMTQVENGLILVTGPTGSGKSTSLAAMVDQINEDRQGHILTIEDPIEFIHQSKNCIVNQREIGRDASSFESALRAALREDPDIILVGEMRDVETISLALTAAETGHLVFGTLHTNSAPSTINRIIDVFKPEQQGQVRGQLAQSLRMVMTQSLHRKKSGGGRVGSFEVMLCNNAVQNLVRENKIHQIPGIMQTARAEGMMTMSKSIEELVSRGLIDPPRAG
ncbi:MAG: PilT/PilU family type 4a pilus ATPase [Arenicellales bacterium]|nr:PilT/PilU family type 4a pilus ATPase [Arenicellales bacterium]